MSINSIILYVIALSIEFVLCLLCSVKLWKHRHESDRSRLVLATSCCACLLVLLAKFTDLMINGADNIMFAYKPNVILRWFSLAVFTLCNFVLLIPYYWKNNNTNRHWLIRWGVTVSVIQTFAITYHLTHYVFFLCAYHILIGIFLVYFTEYELKERLLRHVVLFSSEEEDTLEQNVPSKELSESYQTSPKEKNELWSRINHLLEAESLWKDPDLNLSRLSRLAYSNRTYVTKAFKEHTNMSFAEYIKHKRIEYVSRQLEKNPNQNIKHLFFDAGYRSYPTAWRHFKDVKGMQPTEFTATIGGGKNYSTR